MRLTPRLRRFALIVHITASVGWLGAVAAFLGLAIAGLTKADSSSVRAAYVAMDIVGWYVIVPLSLASLASGLIQSLATEWGLFRHYWVLIKFLLNLGATALLLLHMQPTTHLARAALQHAVTPADFRRARVQLLGDAIAAVFVLLIATALSIYKPWGLTPYGRRAVGRPGVSGAQAVPVPDRGRYVLAALGLLLLVVAIVHLLGGGLGGH